MMSRFFLPVMLLFTGITLTNKPYYSLPVSDETRDTFYIDTGEGLCYLALPKSINKPKTNCGADDGVFDIHTNCNAFKSFKISIVNEAGNLVFESDNPTVKWSGCNGYHAYPQGGYYYTIKYKIKTSEGMEKGVFEKSFTLNWYKPTKRF